MDRDVYEGNTRRGVVRDKGIVSELAALLHKRGAISAPELGRNLWAAAPEAGAETNVAS